MATQREPPARSPGCALNPGLKLNAINMPRADGSEDTRSAVVQVNIPMARF